MTVSARARDLVTLAVRSGCYDKSTLADLIEDIGDEDEVPELKALVKQLSDKQRAAEATWNGATTNDRITRAFAELRRKGVVASENAGYNQPSTPDDAWEDVLDDATNFDEVPHGAVFYCGEDLAAAVAGKGLALTFGALEETGAPGGGTTIIKAAAADALPGLAREICDALARHEVTATADGERIIIAPFRWQRRAFTKPPKPAKKPGAAKRR